jgi:3-oxoacyl-[acyl-carrier-protein] synthase-3
MATNKKYGVKLAGTGSYLPEKILTNADLEKMVETSDEWITTRSGIKERRIADKDTAASDLGAEAARRAIADARIDPNEIDLIIVATVTPDMVFPSTACLIQKKLGLKKSACFDIEAACSGFIYGMACARGMLGTGDFNACLLIGVEVLSKVTDWQDRNTCVLFGDGAGAAVLKRVEEPGDILSIYIEADGTFSNILELPAGGSRMPASEETVKNRMHYIKMDGKEVFKLAVIKMMRAAQKALEKCQKKPEDLAMLIPHQANIRIIDALIEKMKLPKEKVYVNLDRYGNISSATTIIALDEIRKQNKLKQGDLVELVAFGGGLTWGAAVLKV